jgi:hypothetical protein
MSALPNARTVYVTRVHADFTTSLGHVAYKVALSCGCSWWALRDPSAPAPETDIAALCFAAHATVADTPAH